MREWFCKMRVIVLGFALFLMFMVSRFLCQQRGVGDLQVIPKRSGVGVGYYNPKNNYTGLYNVCIGYEAGQLGSLPFKVIVGTTACVQSGLYNSLKNKREVKNEKRNRP